MEQHVMLEARIAKLERRLRLVLVGWIWTLALGVVLGLGARQITAQPTVFRAPYIQAEKLDIIDKVGRPRIRLATFPGGDPYLELYDPKGQTGAQFSMIASMPNLMLSDPSDPRGWKVTLGQLPSPALSFQDSSGRLRIQLGLLPGKNEPYFQILDSRGRVRVLLDVSRLFPGEQHDSPRLVLYDSQGRPRAILTLFPDESAQLGILDSAGKTLFLAP